jgi:hypothetical protein
MEIKYVVVSTIPSWTTCLLLNNLYSELAQDRYPPSLLFIIERLSPFVAAFQIMKYLWIVASLSLTYGLMPQASNSNPTRTGEPVRNVLAPFAAAAIGWTLSAGWAGAELQTPHFALVDSTSVVISAEKLDMSMPSYDSKIRGFEAESYSTAGALEVDLQREAMKKAEEARKDRLREKKVKMEALQAESKRRNAEKKEEARRRVQDFMKGDY